MKYFQMLMMAIFLFKGFSANAFEAEGVLDWPESRLESFSVHGVIEKLTVSTGERVKKNQLLAQLDRRLFVVLIDKYKARVKRLEPLIVDAKVELNHAEELFERTVLSEIDLQKKQGVLKELEAQQEEALADLKLAQIQYGDAQLKAPYDGRLVQVDMLTGEMVSAENISEKILKLVPLGTMRARVVLEIERAVNIEIGQQVQLNIKQDHFKGVVVSLIQQFTQPEKYTVNIEFQHDAMQNYLAGQKVSVEF